MPPSSRHPQWCSLVHPHLAHLQCGLGVSVGASIATSVAQEQARAKMANSLIKTSGFG
jgi:hypothetical protein